MAYAAVKDLWFSLPCGSVAKALYEQLMNSPSYSRVSRSICDFIVLQHVIGCS